TAHDLFPPPAAPLSICPAQFPNKSALPPTKCTGPVDSARSASGPSQPASPVHCSASAPPAPANSPAPGSSPRPLGRKTSRRQTRSGSGKTPTQSHTVASAAIAAASPSSSASSSAPPGNAPDSATQVPPPPRNNAPLSPALPN